MSELFLPTADFRRKKRDEYLSLGGRIGIGTIGRSILSEPIDVYKIGKGKRTSLIIGAHHAMEYISASALYDLIDFFLLNETRGGTYCGMDIPYLLSLVSFYIVPCLNPDGVDMHLNAARVSPLRERQIRMNGGSNDFSQWQANARGVDLNHNYDFRFSEYKRVEREQGIVAGRSKYSGEHPESEPEARSLASFVRALTPDTVISLHAQGGEVFFMPRTAPVQRKAEMFCKKVGYKASTPTDTATYGGFVDYTGGVLKIPSFTVELGRGKNPLPEEAYPAIREIVRTAAILLSLY
ncbi:MAG: hypothetical protein J6V09_04070 [Clostridia bacterium]|nr:hypothetical protein [Clostridia bacterium]